jgi:hypothetical protein
MSIAEEESTRKYYLLEGPEHGDGLLEKLLDAALGNRHVIAQRDAYVKGRTAKPTEAEINAAITEWDRHGYCCRVGTPIVCLCGEGLTGEHGYGVHLVHAILEAARKAVSE